MSYKTKIFPATESHIKDAAAALRAGKLVIIPTETVYGLAANAIDAEAASSIFSAKKRPFFDPLICHIADYDMLEILTDHLSPALKRLTKKFWPGPLTIVTIKSEKVPRIITSGLQTVAIRMPAHPVAISIIKEAGVPLAAPSANLFGKLSPTRPEHTLDLQQSVHSIIDGGPCEIGVESTIIRELDGKIVILRPGKITPKQIEETVHMPVITSNETEVPDAPGQLPSHYAPASPVVLIDEGETPSEATSKSVLLAFRKDRDNSPFMAATVLSATGSLNQAASQLFDCLHKLDKLSPDTIYVERVPSKGIGIAIMNRLTKAAFNKVG
ncbi:MAG: threonylcarbamoyl-AMP synthase [Spirochaetes bacterium]|nr:threonylcarbamoyl-AMP synthase [Spirochaetota bacterium]MBN2771822.1 threonylcarbamoyl-AMP synthase [Spirochaetota bacterium]